MKKILLFALLAAISVFANAQETDITTLEWVKKGQDCANDFNNAKGSTVFGTDAGGSNLSYVDVSAYGKIKLYGPAGQTARLFINREEFGTGTFQFYVEINEEGVGEFECKKILEAQPTAQYIHLNGVKAQSYDKTLNLTSITVSGDPITFPIIDPVITYDPIILAPNSATELSKLTGTNANWASTVVYPKEFAVQGAAFGDGNGDKESTHVTVPENSKLVFNVSQGSTGLGLRVWVWNGSGVVTLYAYPEAEYATANFTVATKVTDPGIYCVNLNGYTLIKGVKAANDWGAPAIKVNYAYIISNTETKNIAVDEARTLSSDNILDFSEVTDVDAYIATGIADNKVTMKKVTGAVPANTGLILIDKTGKSVVSIPTCGEATENVAGNLLVATTAATTVEKATTGTNYVLAGSGETLGWYSIGSTSASLEANKCYLSVPASSSAKVLDMVFDEETTAIQNIESTTSANGAYYSLQGVRVANPQKGIYIKNGKKIIIK